VTATSANSPRHGGGGFTLLEIIIALSLVAILVTASLPYLLDSFAFAEGDRASEAIATKALETRSLAMQSGERQRLSLTPGGIRGMELPRGWNLQIRGLNDAKFHSPEKGRTWEFTAAGLCEPLSVRLVQEGRGGRIIETTFDALTAQPVHEED
jgi:prepilin-type N-terminal cleavage/methylation domain-containing protein